MKNKILNTIFVSLNVALLTTVGVSTLLLYNHASLNSDPDADTGAVGNMPSPAREITGFGSGLLQWFEDTRYQMDYIYLNYVPFSMDIISMNSRFNTMMNTPVNNFLNHFQEQPNGTVNLDTSQKNPELIPAVSQSQPIQIGTVTAPTSTSINHGGAPSTVPSQTDATQTTNAEQSAGSAATTSLGGTTANGGETQSTKPGDTQHTSQTTSTSKFTTTTTESQPVVTQPAPAQHYLAVPEGVNVADYRMDYIKSTRAYSYYLVTLYLDNGNQVQYYEKVGISPIDTLREKMYTQLAEINRVASSDQNVNFVVYIPTSFQMSENFNYYFGPYGETQLTDLLYEYLNALPPNVTYGTLQHYNLADRANLGFMTDHHWSAEGVWRGYQDIVNLFRLKCDSILPPYQEPSQVIQVQPCQFYGSYAREIANDSIYDPFIVYDYNLPAHSAFFNRTTPYNFYDRIQVLMDANVCTLNSNAYGTFFQQVTSVQYPDNHTGRNLLVLGDSYTRSIAELLASSFDNTYLLYFRTNTYQNVDYNQFIRDNQITDVLYMQYSERALFNYTSDAKLDLIITSN